MRATSTLHRLDELVETLEWHIATAPEHGHPLEGTPFRFVRSHLGIGSPIVRLFYTVNDADVCSLWHIDQVEGPETMLLEDEDDE